MRFRALDGFRAIAIMLVIFSHIMSHGNLPINISIFEQFFNFGRLGVQIFFVLSGFLITNILLNKQQKTGNIDLKEFYIRRALRIFPAFYFFICATSITVQITSGGMSFSEILHALTYTGNYVPRFLWSDTHWYLGHAWSLAVEEQFYILWPFALALLGFSRGPKIAITLVLICPMLRVFYEFGGIYSSSLSHSDVYKYLSGCRMYSFDSIGDALATGCLLAIWKEKLFNHRIYHRILTHSRFIYFAIATLLFFQLLSGEMIRRLIYDTTLFNMMYLLVGFSMSNIIIAMIIHWLLVFPQTRLATFFQTKPMVGLGMLSYSLYLWQQPFFFPKYSIATAFPNNIIFIVCCAVFSYYIIEKPFLKLKDKLS